MGRPRPSQSFPPAPGYRPPALSFFASMCAFFGAAKPPPPAQAVSDADSTR